MAGAADSFTVYCAGNLMPSFFGDPTIIVTGIPVNKSHLAEYFILYSKDGNPLMKRGQITMDISQVPPDVIGPWELKHTVEEANAMALRDYREYIESTYPVAKEIKLFDAPYHFVTAGSGHLARLWIRNQHHAGITQIQKATNCQSLRSFLEEVRHFPVIKVGS